MAEKFNITQSQPVPQKKDFQIPLPGFQSKPSVIIGKAAIQAYHKIFIAAPTPGQREDKQYLITQQEIEDQPIGRSKIFNQPIYSDLTFSAGSYVDNNGNTVNYDSLQIDLVIITVRNSKNIIKTALQGRDGTVKEYISSGDDDIKIEGVIYGNGINNYPQSDIQKLIALTDVPQSLKVTSSFLKMFNIQDIVIEDSDIKQMEGARNYQPFTLYCCSDTPLILLKNA